VPTVLVESLPVSQTSNGAPKVSILATKSANAEQDVEEGKESNIFEKVPPEISDKKISGRNVLVDAQLEYYRDIKRIDSHYDELILSLYENLFSRIGRKLIVLINMKKS